MAATRRRPLLSGRTHTHRRGRSPFHPSSSSGLRSPSGAVKAFVRLSRPGAVSRSRPARSRTALVCAAPLSNAWPSFRASTLLRGPSKPRAAAILLAPPRPPPPKGATSSAAASAGMNRAGPRDPTARGVRGPGSDRSPPPSGHPARGRGSQVLHRQGQPVGSRSGSSEVCRKEAAACPRAPQLTRRPKAGGPQRARRAGRTPFLTTLSAGTYL